ncbi:MAG: methyltransferase domain-containing protein [Robiginitomaculum sp.]
MSKPKQDIFDQKIVRLRRGRGQRIAGSTFLLDRCADDLCERLLDINRSFEHTLIIGDKYFAKRVIRRLSGKIKSYAQLDDTTHNAQIIAAATALPFKNNSFDLVINGLTLHSVNDIPKAMLEAKRVLKPDGLFVGALFGGATLTELRHAFYKAEETIYGAISPRIAPMIDMSLAAKLLQKAGLTMPVVDKDNFTVNYKKLETLFADLRRMGDTNALTARRRVPSTKSLFTELEYVYKKEFSDNEKYRVRFEILWLTGWASHSSQQKPLKPGSAKTRLSEVLGVKEYKL